MTKYVISGYIGFDNFGDEAILKVLTNYLKKNGAEKITALSSNPEKTSALYGVDSVNYLKFIKPIKETDILISGGGSLLQDITSLKSLLYYLSVIMTAIVFNKKVIIFAQGFTPFKTKIGKFLTGFVLKRCHKIFVRDTKSQDILQKMGIKSEFLADPVYGIEVPKVENRKGIGIQLRYFHTLTDEFLEKLADKVSKCFKDEEIRLYSLQDSLDLEVLNNFSEKLEKRNINYKIYKNLSVEEGIKELINLEYLIGMRFHAALVASKAGVKVLGINYDIKVLNLAKTIGFPLIGLNQDSFDEEFEELFSLDTFNYKIPEFKFPEI